MQISIEASNVNKSTEVQAVFMFYNKRFAIGWYIVSYSMQNPS